MAKILYCLRQDLDIQLLIGINTTELNKLGAEKIFWGHIQNHAIISSVVINICKVYELEKRYPLDSIPGILEYIIKKKLHSKNESTVTEFCQKYEGPCDCQPIEALHTTFEGFKKKNSAHLERLKNSRDKIFAHRKSGVDISTLPSYAIMENLFDFGVDFYDVISHSFIGHFPAELKNNRPVRKGLIEIFKRLGIQEIKTDFDDE